MNTVLFLVFSFLNASKLVWHVAQQKRFTLFMFNGLTSTWPKKSLFEWFPSPPRLFICATNGEQTNKYYLHHDKIMTRVFIYPLGLELTLCVAEMHRNNFVNIAPQQSCALLIIIIIIVNTDVTGNHGLNVYKICNNATNINKEN